MNEASARQVLPENDGFLICQVEPAGFDHVCHRIFEKIGVCDPRKVRIWKYVKIGEPLNSAHVFTIRAGTVHGPAGTLWWKEVAAAEFRAAVVLGNKPAPAAR